MKSLKKIVCLVLCLVMVMSATACAKTDPVPPVTNPPSVTESPTETPVVEPTETPTENPVDAEKPEVVPSGQDFDTELKAFLLNEGTLSDSYMVSPMSYRFAMGMLTAGANGDTQKELLGAMNFATIDEYMDWAANIIAFSETFKELVNTEETVIEPEINEDSKYEFFAESFTPATGAFNIANSIWHNANDVGIIKAEFIESMETKYNAQVYEIPLSDMVVEINNWVNENTKGMIPQIINNLPEEVSTVLVNTIYFKSAWRETFTDLDEQKPFQGVKGEVMKDFMSNRESYLYYADDASEMVVIPMEGNVDVVLIKGDDTDYQEKLNNGTYRELNLYIPKWETETSLENSELVNFLAYKGVGNALVGGADFSNMIDTAIHIDDIIQKTVIKLDEEGLEASAATAIIMMNDAIAIPEKPLDVYFDETFQYYIVANTDNGPEVMFFGQLGD